MFNEMENGGNIIFSLSFDLRSSNPLGSRLASKTFHLVNVRTCHYTNRALDELDIDMKECRYPYLSDE